MNNRIKQATKFNIINVLNISLNNAYLYDGCIIEELAGRLTLATPIEEATDIVEKNAKKIIEKFESKEEITLRGAMDIWSYLIVFHAVVDKFNKVYLDLDGHKRVLVAAHG